jgi:photosystem II stability/assembly factor-like uncharacterized protein
MTRRLTLVAVVIGLLALAGVAVYAGGGFGGGSSRAVVSSGVAPGGPGSVAKAELLDGTHGWALGSHGLFWTSDAGTSWASVTPPSASASPESLNGVAFLPDGRGWAVASESASAVRVWRRVGDSWTSSLLHPPAPVTGQYGPASLSFVDPMHGWIVLDGGSHGPFSPATLWRTADGGASWARLSVPGSGVVHFVSPSLGFLAARPNGPRAGGLYVTHDGGVSWSQAALPSSADVEQPPSIAAGVATVVAPNLDRTAASVFTSTDDGRSWKVVAQKPAPPGATDLSWTAAGSTVDLVWSTVRGAAVAQSADGGRTFADRSAGGVAQVLSLSASDARHVWTVSAAGALLASNDAGATWHRLSVP